MKSMEVPRAGLILLLATMLTMTSHTQSVHALEDYVQWSTTFGGSQYEWGGFVVQTSDGGYAISGQTESSASGDRDFWLVRTDSTGNTLWNRTYGQLGSKDEGISLIETCDGGYAIIGWKGPYSEGREGRDFWLVKTDSAGNIQWDRVYGGPQADHGYKVIQTSDGGYAVIGTTESFGAGDADLWLIKTDVNGNSLWNRTYGGRSADHGYELIQTNDGGYALVGYTWSFGAGAHDGFLVKTDSDGNVQWDKTYGGTSDEWLYDIIETDDGGYVLAGQTWSYGAGGLDYWLIKIDSSGEMQWMKTYGGQNDDCGNNLIPTLDGGYMISGGTRSFGSGDWDVWLVKTGTDGIMRWNQTYGGVASDWSWSTIQTRDGGFAVAGWTASFGAGGEDIWLIKIMVIPSISDSEAYVTFMNETIQGLPEAAFNRPDEDVPCLKGDFSDLFNDAMENLNEENYEAAIDKLNRVKEEIYENIVESFEREELIDRVNDLITYLDALI